MKISLRLFAISIGRMALAVVVVALLALPAWAAPAVEGARQKDLIGPPGSGAFGTSVTALPNGNIVVTDPFYDAGAIADVGAVYLYNGATGTLISKLTGSTAGDQVGYAGSYQPGVTVLSNGNYLVGSLYWNNIGAADVGAVTWGNASTGVSGVVSAANSLVGSTANDQVGYRLTMLGNGNYVVHSPYWDNGAAANAGAVTWGNGTTGVSGVISNANSLVGSTANDQVGSYVTVLNNDNYVVSSPNWHNGAIASAGAVTWGNGTTSITGPVLVANSLVGSTTLDSVGDVTALSNGNYVVRSRYWDNGATGDAGAVTWGNGTTGTAGVVSAANSLVGSTADDEVGSDGVTVLSNGNYVVSSRYWDNGAVADAGAVTWGNGATGSAGAVSVANSLVGSTASDSVGYRVTALNNGNYVVSSYTWDNGAVVNAGAVTWGNGATGVSGVVSAANSLVGSTVSDQVGGVTALHNGNYVVSSPDWDNGAIIGVGAVTWGNGTTGIAGPVSVANSLVGSTAYDHVGWQLTALSNGNYVVSSSDWDNGGVADVGAATWGNGTTGTAGVVAAANSLIGSTAYDGVGRVTALSNGNYVVRSLEWDNGGALDAGAVTWGNGATGVSGAVSAANSLVGSGSIDQTGSGGVKVLGNGNYVVSSPNWGGDYGAVTWGNGTAGISGAVSAANSLVGSTADDHVGWGDLTGFEGVVVLSNGNYVVSSPKWDNDAVVDAGAVTWGNGTTGVSGMVSAANSLVGNSANDSVGFYDATALGNGGYVVMNPYWDNGAMANTGAVTWGNGTAGTAGPISAQNSVRGTAAGNGSSMIWAFDYANDQLVVGRPADNIVTLFRFRPFFSASLPLVLKNK